jgi:hypothetical protein
MSALNIIKQRDRVVLVTDGAVWDVNAGVVHSLCCFDRWNVPPRCFAIEAESRNLG